MSQNWHIDPYTKWKLRTSSLIWYVAQENPLSTQATEADCKLAKNSFFATSILVTTFQNGGFWRKIASFYNILE